MPKAEKITKKSAKTVKTDSRTTSLKVLDMRAKSANELTEEVTQARRDLAEAYRSLSAGELVNPRVIGKYKKTIARLRTVMVEQASHSQVKEDS